MNALNYFLKMKLQLSLGWNEMNNAQGHCLLSLLRKPAHSYKFWYYAYAGSCSKGVKDCSSQLVQHSHLHDILPPHTGKSKHLLYSCGHPQVAQYMLNDVLCNPEVIHKWVLHWDMPLMCTGKWWSIRMLHREIVATEFFKIVVNDFWCKEIWM